MNKERKSYGLLVGVSRYEEERGDLPAAGQDVILMKLALTGGLKFNEDNIRVLGEQGAVEARSFARALSEFEGLIEREDTFILYFSGHGTREGLCFTDRMVNLQSIVDYVERMRAERKVVILDCCYAGDMHLTREEESP